MAEPNAWSHTALDTFENCPRQYHETKVLKRWPFETSKAMEYGREVHKYFENFLVHGTPLPADLQMHGEFLADYKAQPGVLVGEERIALDNHLKPCAYFLPRDAPNKVWYRGQIDARRRNGAHTHILDHKTGKVKNDYTQLKGFAIHEFISNPEAQEVRVEFYWTQIRGANGETYRREQLQDLINYFMPKLHRFADAFLTDTWIPKQSGLCNGWCPVTDCDFWRPKRVRA